MDTIHTYWERTLYEDIRGFADPHTDVLVDCQGSTFETLWTQRGNEHADSLELSANADFRWIHPSTGERHTYRRFLSHRNMADFDHLSKSIVRSFAQETNYIPGKAILDNDLTLTQHSHDILLDATHHSISTWDGITRLYFVKGDAGIGKTTLLREITRQQAKQYSQGDSPFLYLYVSAQGRALSNLLDALSGELDDLRAGFTRDAVPALVRNGLLVPIIDGFDELLGAAGYGDAFGSLHEFLDSLQSKGALIVSARSSFYEIEFTARPPSSTTDSSVYEIEPVTLLPWTHTELAQYLATYRSEPTITETDKQVLESLPETDRDLLTKPFFASLFPQYIDAANGTMSSIPLVDFLVHSYVQRESEKIVDRDNKPLLAANGHQRIFELVSEFMWEDEKRGFNASELRTVAELVAEEHELTSDSTQQLVTKVTSYAGFRALNQGGDRRFVFEHEVYFDHFLSQSLRNFLPSSDADANGNYNASSFGRFLDRSILPEEVINFAIGSGRYSTWLELVANVQRNTLRNDNRRRNLGAFVAACFRKIPILSQQTIRSCHFVSTSFGSVKLEEVDFRDCRFNIVYLESADFVSCKFSGNTMAEKIVVSRNGKLGISGLNPGVNVACVVDVETGKESYSPVEIMGILRDSGIPEPEDSVESVVYSSHAQDIIDLLQKVHLKYLRSNALSRNDVRLRGIFRDAHWEELHSLLVSHEIVREETRQTSGPQNIFLRNIISFSDLMKLELQPYLPQNGLGTFWRDVRNM